MSLNQLLESANPYHSMQSDAAKLASKWEKTGLLEGLEGTHKNNMGIILERGSSDNVFIGWDESADRVKFATTSATGASTGNLTLTDANIEANMLYGDVTGDVTGNADTATALATARAIALTGDVTGSANFDGTAGISISATIAANSVALGTDTTGNYMAQVSGGDGITISHTQGEGSTATITGTAIYNSSGTKLN